MSGAGAFKKFKRNTNWSLEKKSKHTRTTLSHWHFNDLVSYDQLSSAIVSIDIPTLEVKGGRNVGVTNSGFGTVFGVVDGEPEPDCDYAGFAPFGFSYRRCPGEQLTIQIFEQELLFIRMDLVIEL
jgi:hypothetical protein